MRIFATEPSADPVAYQFAVVLTEQWHADRQIRARCSALKVKGSNAIALSWASAIDHENCHG
jgi:hypothetical protein